MAANSPQQFSDNSQVEVETPIVGAPYMVPVNEEISKQIREANSINKKQNKKQKLAHQRFQMSLVTIMGAVTCWFVLQMGVSIFGIINANAALIDTKAQYEKVLKTNDQLKLQNKNLKNPDFLAQVMRDKYQYSKYGEVIFNLPTSAFKK
jgi:cell division protein DivIC